MSATRNYTCQSCGQKAAGNGAINYCNLCHPIPVKKGCKSLGDCCSICWYVFADLETAKAYADEWLQRRYSGPGGEYSDRPAFRTRRNGQVLVTQQVGLDI